MLQMRLKLRFIENEKGIRNNFLSRVVHSSVPENLNWMHADSLPNFPPTKALQVKPEGDTSSPTAMFSRDPAIRDCRRHPWLRMNNTSISLAEISYVRKKRDFTTSVRWSETETICTLRKK